MTPRLPPEQRRNRDNGVPQRRTPVATIQIVEMMMAGATMAQISERTGMHRTSIDRRIASPEGQRLLATAEREVMERLSRSLATSANAGVRTLVQAATTDGVPWPARVSAARALIEMAVGVKVRLAGADGGPIQLEVGAARDALEERFTAMSQALAIETTGGPVDAPLDPPPVAQEAPRR